LPDVNAQGGGIAPSGADARDGASGMARAFPFPPAEIFAGEFTRVAFFGGIYSNYLALEAAFASARALGAEAIFALGDFGAFGPYPDRALDLLRENRAICLRGNYEEALVEAAEDCRCGYVDPRDNHYARLSYDYTAARTSAHHKTWMAGLPAHLRLTLGGKRVLGCHGSPRKVNEFLWESASSDAFLRRLLREHGADLIVCTHTGLPWARFLEAGRGLVNAGALGRPANDGRLDVSYALLEAAEGNIKVTQVPVAYDYGRLAREMRVEGLPPEFIETIVTGWWTTCLEILPAKERARGRF
jgi:predicted phosphodiesterase